MYEAVNDRVARLSMFKMTLQAPRSCFIANIWHDIYIINCH